MLESELKQVSKGNIEKQIDEESKSKQRQENQNQSRSATFQMHQNQTQYLQNLQEELKQDLIPPQNPQNIQHRRNKSQSFKITQKEQQYIVQERKNNSRFRNIVKQQSRSQNLKSQRKSQGDVKLSEKEEMYLKEINRLNEVIASNNQYIEVIIMQMDIQEKLMNMVVHDMRNPSEAINNGLSQAKQLIASQLEHISKELKDSSEAYFQKNRQLNGKSNYFKLINQSIQVQVENLDRSQGQSQNDIDSSPNPVSNKSDAQENILQIGNQKFLENDQISPLRQQLLEESKNIECEIGSLDKSENICFQENNSPIINRGRPKIEQNLQFQNLMMNQPLNVIQPESKQQDYASQIQQFINFSENLQNINEQSLQIIEKQDDQIIEEEKELHLHCIHQNDGHRLEQQIKVINNDIQDLNKLINENYNGVSNQNRQQLNQNNENQEDDNYSDFNQDDLDEDTQPLPPQNLQPNQNQIDQQINENLGSSLIINQIRNMNVHEGSQYVKRSRQRINMNAQVIKAKEVYIFKENTVLRTDSSIQTQNQNDIDLNFKNQLLNILVKIQKNFENLEKDENLIKLIQDLKNSRIKTQKNEQPQIIHAIQNIQQQRCEIAKNQENERLQKLKIQNQNMQQRRQSMSKVAYYSNLLKNNSVQKINQIRQRGFSLCQSQIINEFKQNNLSPMLIQEARQSMQNQTIRQQSNQGDVSNLKCEACKISIKMILSLLQKLKQVFKLVSNTDYYVQNSISSANVISNLTEDLLTLAKIKNNVFELNIESNVNLLEIVYEAFQVLSFNANSKNISFELEHQKNRKFIVQNVQTDKRRILQILLNFISNSVKFTSQNGVIKVILKVVSESMLENKGIINQQIVEQKNIDSMENDLLGKKVKIQIQIQDNGAGISKENLKKLFSDFGKLNEHKQMNIKGTGLGLSICKQIIEQMGGNVKVQSKVGVGSKFIIQLEMHAFEQISATSDSQKSIKKLYPETIINNFLKIDKSGEEDIYLSSDDSDQSQNIIYRSKQSQQIGKNKVLFQFIHSNIQRQEANKDKYQIQVNNIIRKMKYQYQENLVQGENQLSQIISSYSQNEQINIIQDNINRDQESLSKNLISLNQSRQVRFLNGASQIKNNQSFGNNASLNISENISDNSSNKLKNQFILEKSNKNHYLNLENSSFQSSNHRQYIINQLDQNEDQEDEISENQNSENVKNFNQENGNLNQIEEAIELSSQYLSQSGEQSNNNLSASILKSQQSQIINNNKIPQDFQKYLENNDILKQVIDISFKYKREKLNILVANDDSYQLFFIQTCIEKFENVSLINTAQNGLQALDFVKKNEPVVQQQESQNFNFYNIIFLDLEMPIMDGNEACKQIQNHYYSQSGRNSLKEYLKNIPFLKHKMNLVNEHQNSQYLIKEQDEEWVLDLKRIYDIYQDISQNQDQNTGKEKPINNQQKLKNEIIKVFNIMYQKLRYNSLKQLKRPFMFAYSAFINQKIIDETLKNGFDKCIEAPLNQLKIESLLDEYVENYCLNITKQMLEKLGPVPKFEEMIDFQKIINGNKRKSSSLYSSLFKVQDRGFGSFKSNSSELQRREQQNPQVNENKLENLEQNMVLFKINETVQEQSQSSEKYGAYVQGDLPKLSINNEEEKKESNDHHSNYNHLNNNYFNFHQQN